MLPLLIALGDSTGSAPAIAHPDVAGHGHHRRPTSAGSQDRRRRPPVWEARTPQLTAARTPARRRPRPLTHWRRASGKAGRRRTAKVTTSASGDRYGDAKRRRCDASDTEVPMARDATGAQGSRRGRQGWTGEAGLDVLVVCERGHDRAGRRPADRAALPPDELPRVASSLAAGGHDRPAARPAVAGARAERRAAAVPALVPPLPAPQVRRRLHRAPGPRWPAAGVLHPARAREGDLRRATPRSSTPARRNAILGPIMGEHSLLLQDSGEHKRARKLLMPAFNGHALRGYESLVTELAREEVGALAAGHGVPGAGPDERAHPRGHPARRLRRHRRGPARRAAAAGQRDRRHQPGGAARLGLPEAAAVRPVEAHRRRTSTSWTG